VDLAQQAHRQRESFSKTLKSVIRSCDITRYFLNVVHWHTRDKVIFKKQQLGKCGLSSFDLRRKHGLFSYVTIKKKVGVWQERSDTAQATNGDAGPLKQGSIPSDRWNRGQRGRYKCMARLTDCGNR